MWKSLSGSFKKGGLRIIPATLALTISLSSAAFAGQWVQDGQSWKYQKDDGSFVINMWQGIDGKLYCFDTNGVMYVDTVTPGGYTVDSSGAWVVDGVVQTHNDTVVTSDYEGQYPLKGRIEKYFVLEPAVGMVWTGAKTGVGYDALATAIEKQDILYINNFGTYTAALGRLAGMANVPTYIGTEPELADYYQRTAINIDASEAGIREFLDSFDWRNASELEKAVRICERLHQADYKVGAHFFSDNAADCGGYASAAEVLGAAIGLQVCQIPDLSINHTYPVFYVNGVWLANEPTSKNKYFTIADVYQKNPGFEELGFNPYKQIGQFCEALGYQIPNSIPEVFPGASTGRVMYQGRGDLALTFDEALRLAK